MFVRVSESGQDVKQNKVAGCVDKRHAETDVPAGGHEDQQAAESSRQLPEPLELVADVKQTDALEG